MFFYILAGVAVVTGYASWRRKKRVRFEEETKDIVPSDNQLQWNEDDQPLPFNSSNQTRTNTNQNKGYGFAAGTAVLGSLPSFYYLSEIDSSVTDAMDFAFSQDLTNFNTLSDFVDEKFLGVLSTDGADGWLTRLEGYVMEKESAEALEDMGYDVQFPDSSTEEGWDLLVDGIPWQVKGGESPQVISNHFEKYPDTPVVTNEALGEHFADYEQVMAIQGLQADDISHMTEQNLSSIDHLETSIDLGIPVMSLFTASAREFRLHREHKTDLESSIKNAGLDVAGVGGGGFGGAQLGAMLGAAGGPAGAAVGGLIGGVLGALGGKGVTNKLKAKDMNQAWEYYEYRVGLSERVLNKTEEKERQRLIDAAEQVSQDLELAKDDIVQVYQAKFNDEKRTIFEKKYELLKSMPFILEEIHEELKKAEKQMDQAYTPPKWYKRLLAPSKDVVIYKQTKKWFKARYDIINQAQEQFSGPFPQEESSILKYYNDMISFLKQYHIDNDTLTTNITDLIEDIENGKHVRQSMLKDIYLHLLQAEEHMRQETKDTFKNIAKNIKEQEERIKQARDKFEREKGKLGL